jgi:hypothetical protein
MEKIYCTILI